MNSVALQLVIGLGVFYLPSVIFLLSARLGWQWPRWAWLLGAATALGLLMTLCGQSDGAESWADTVFVLVYAVLVVGLGVSGAALGSRLRVRDFPPRGARGRAVGLVLLCVGLAAGSQWVCPILLTGIAGPAAWLMGLQVGLGCQGVLWAWMLVEALLSADRGRTSRIEWLLVVVLGGPLGATAYFVMSLLEPSVPEVTDPDPALAGKL